MKTTLISAAVLAYSILLTAYSFSQGTAINTTGAKADNSAILDVNSQTQGVLMPRLTEAQKNLISVPANGLLIYQTDGLAGYYYNAGSGIANWMYLGSDNLGNHTATDSLNMSNNKIYNLATCTQNLDAANKEYVDNAVSAGGGGGGGGYADTTYYFAGVKILQVNYGGTTFTVPSDKIWSIESAFCNSSVTSYPVIITAVNGNGIFWQSSITTHNVSGNSIWPPVFPYWLPGDATISFNVGSSGTHKGWVSVREYKRVIQ